MSKPLTAAAVERLRPANARREIPDGACPGLFLVIQPSGAKSWALRFRRPDGRPAKLVLGSVHTTNGAEPTTLPTIGGHLTLAAAHRLVGELRHQIAQGSDPAADHLAAKERHRAEAIDAAANTFGAAAKEFIEKYASTKVRRWKEQAHLLGLRPAADGLEVIRGGLAERWANKPISEIDGHDIHGIVDETRRRGAPGLERRAKGQTESRARAMLSCLSRMFRWLVQHRKVSVNPCAGVHRPETPQSRDRVLSNDEIVKFWSAASDAGAPFSVALKLLLLTGCRLNEVAGIRGEELGDEAKWTIPSARTKNRRPHVVPLPPLALELIEDVTRIEGSDFLFTTTGRSPISGWSKIKGRLDKAMGDVPPWRLHDLRRTAATGMAELGIAPHIVEAALNHISGAKAGVAGTYNRAAYSAEKKAALERWAVHVVGLVSNKRGKVVSLHHAGGAP